jgi:hypothetical protein
MRDEADRKGRFSRLERAGDDFPFYDGQPVALSRRQWRDVLGATLAGLLILTLGGPLLAKALGSIIVARLAVAGLFAGLPLAALARAAPQGWRLLFRRIGWRDILLMFGFAALNLIVTLTVALTPLQYLHMTVNPIVDIKLAGPGAVLGFLVWTAVQLLGEELLTMLPFLAILTLGFGRFGMGRRGAMTLAWLGSSLTFALAHLPTYNWNILQCLMVVGVARLVLTLAYVRTKNLWVSAGAHILYDWTIFAFVALVGGLPLPPG